jgi:hypothetical protein
VEHKNLRQNGDSFQVNGECPQELFDGAVVVNQYREGNAWQNVNPPLEGIVFCGLVFVGTFVWVNKAHQYYDEQ